MHTPPPTPPSVPQGTPPHLHSDTLTDRGDSDHTHTSHTHSRISTPENESDTHALREGGAHSGRDRMPSPGAGLESQDDGTLSDLSHSCSFPSDRPNHPPLADPVLASSQRLEFEDVDQPGHSFDDHEVPTTRVPFTSTPPPSSQHYNHSNGGVYQSRIPRRLPGHTPSRPHPSHAHSAQEYRKSSLPNSSWQSPIGRHSLTIQYTCSAVLHCCRTRFSSMLL